MKQISTFTKRVLILNLSVNSGSEMKHFPHSFLYKMGRAFKAARNFIGPHSEYSDTRPVKASVSKLLMVLLPRYL